MRIEVPSESSPIKQYVVQLNDEGHPFHCTCKGFQWRQSCKHLSRAMARPVMMKVWKRHLNDVHPERRAEMHKRMRRRYLYLRAMKGVDVAMMKVIQSKYPHHPVLKNLKRNRR